MALTITRVNLRTRIRQRADIENDTHVADTELNDRINVSVALFYDLLLESAPPDYYSTTSAVAVVSGTTAYALPADFYKLRALYRDWGSGRYTELKSINAHERVAYEPPDAATLSMRYIATPPVLANDSDPLDTVAEWAEVVVLDVAIYAYLKKELDPTFLMNERDRIERRIRGMGDRDVGSPRRVSSRNKHMPMYQDVYTGSDTTAYQLVGSNLEVYKCRATELL